MVHNKDDLLTFADDGSIFTKSSEDNKSNDFFTMFKNKKKTSNEDRTWKVLIVDDEEDVHRVTKLLLEDFRFQDKTLNLLSAYNEKEAINYLEEHDDISLVLLDVVMDTEDSGLKLVKYIREQQMNSSVRIVLRTGQPGQAPERKVIVDYDINDYKLKTELTADKLFVTVVSALRSYMDIDTLRNNSISLEKVIDTSQHLFKERKMNAFSKQVLWQMKDIFVGKDNNGVSVKSGFIATKDSNNESYMMVSGFNKYNTFQGKPLDENISTHVEKLIVQAKETQGNLHYDNECVSFFRGQNHVEHVIYFEFSQELNQWDKNICDIYFSTIGIALNNLYLSHEVESTQQEIIFTLGEVAEARSQELGNHVKRVSEYVKLLAMKYGLEEDEADLISMASPVHDVGKLAIPDRILNKPGRLTDEEFEIIKSHATAGYEMLKNSKRLILKTAAIIAIQHHEKWDGSGYPRGLKGDDIHIYGRIVAIADVFDALSSDRIYKEAWPFSRILEYIREEKGKHFDPDIADIFIRNIGEFIRIHDKYRDFIN